MTSVRSKRTLPGWAQLSRRALTTMSVARLPRPFRWPAAGRLPPPHGTRTGDQTRGSMRTERPPPGDRTLSQLIQAAGDRKCPYCKVEPQQPCTWPSPDKYHIARFKGIGMTQAERRTIEAATRVDSGRHTGPKGYLVGELRPYRAEPQPEGEAGQTGHRCTSAPEPRPMTWT